MQAVGVLALISPFTSLRAIVKDIAGNLASYLVEEKLQNLKLIPKVNSPVFIVHGLLDKLISCE